MLREVIERHRSKADADSERRRSKTDAGSRVVIYRPDRTWWAFVGWALMAIVVAITRQFDNHPERDELLINYLLLGPVMLFFLPSAWRRFIITTSDEGKCLRIELHRWPLASRITLYRVAEIHDVIADLNTSIMDDSGTRRIVFVMSSGRREPLTREFKSGDERHERAVREIKELLHEPAARRLRPDGRMTAQR